jgi:hypothetical protein
MAHRPYVTLSKSSIGLYEECARKWALHYQAKRTPIEIRREVLFQKRLMGYFALVGQVADDAITYSLRKYVAKGEWPKDLGKGIRNLIQQYLDETEQWRYMHESGTNEPQEGRRQPIDRYYFDGLPSEEEVELIAENVSGFVDTWFASPVPQMLLDYGVDTWEVPIINTTPSFKFEKITIWAKYDFAVRTPDETILFDWKTGRVSDYSENEIRDQLHTYAEFAIREWGAEPGKIKLYGVWLAAGAENCLTEYPFEESRLGNLEREWQAKHETFVHLLESAGRNYEHLFDVFPLTQQVHRCKGCKFRACEGFGRIEG